MKRVLRTFLCFKNSAAVAAAAHDDDEDDDSGDGHKQICHTLFKMLQWKIITYVPQLS
jgi:hypothetical protein